MGQKMKDFKLTVSIILQEGTPGEHACFDSTIASSAVKRVILGELRGSKRQGEMKQIISREIKLGVEYVSKQLLSKVTLPLNETLNDQINNHESCLNGLIPGFLIGILVSDGTFVVYKIMKSSGPYHDVDIPHPKDPNSVLTTEYPDQFCKLEDGTWTYMYQGSDFYKEVVKIIDPPIDEAVISNYFNGLGLRYSIQTHPFRELPEVREDEDEDRDY
jgi:hypothetical protein